MRGVLVVLAVVLSLAIVANAADLLNANSKTRVDGQYIVVFHTNSTAAIRDLHVAELVSKRFSKEEKILHVYEIGNFIGYAAVLKDETLIAELKHPNVRYIEVDQTVSINEDFITQPAPPSWGLDRTDQKALPLDQIYRYFTSGGSGVTAYIVDTGILTTHVEFAPNRAVWGYSAVTGEADTDLNGHGTHVAGTVGGINYGVAKKVTLVAVKVLNSAGSGTIAGVVAGVNWATTDHTNRGRDARSVANMSLGGGAAAALDDAVTASIAGGISYAIAAGNNNGASACNYSPARVPTAITVGATANTDARATFSNIGICVDIFAPGQNIVSSYIGSNSATATLSGTSMAAPHVAGVVAVRLGNLLADQDPVPPTPAVISAWIVDPSVAIGGVVGNPGTGSPNLLLYSPFQTSTATTGSTTGGF